MGEGGVIPLTEEFLVAARQLADRTGAVLIFDEIQCGLGRTGTLFAFQKSGVVPDIVTLAKPLGGGLPLGAVLTGPALEGLVKPGHHGTTFGGNPVACRLGLAVLDEIEQSSLLEKVQQTGGWFGTELKKLKMRMPSVVEVRGAGMIWGIELDTPAKPIAAELLARGFVVGTARDNVIRLLPPYITPKKAFVEFIGALEQVLASVGAQYSPKGEPAVGMNPKTGAVLALAQWPRVNDTDPGASPRWADMSPAVRCDSEHGTTVQAITAAGPLQRLPARFDHPHLRPLPGRDHHRGRNRVPHRARAGDDYHRDGRGEGAHRRRAATGATHLLGGEPDGEGDRRQRQHHGNEHRADAIGEMLNRRPRPLGVAHQPDDLREDAGVTHRGSAKTEGARPVDRRADDRIPR